MELKRDSLAAARFDDPKSEQWRTDIVEWLTEAKKTRTAQQPALYLKTLDELSEALNALPVTTDEFKQYVGVNAAYNRTPAVGNLEVALRALPLPAPKDLKDSYVELLDREVEVRTKRLDQLEAKVSDTEAALQDRLDALAEVTQRVDALRAEIQSGHESIAAVRESAENTIRSEWDAALGAWKQEREKVDSGRDVEAVTHIATLAATAKAGESLAEHAAGSLSATDWYGRSKRERRAAQWMRAGAAFVFVLAGAIGWFIVTEAIRNNFDLTVGDGILRSAVAIVVGAFGALLLRESGRHFREADTAEDVALSLKALAPFYANSEDEIRLAARVQVGDAVLVKNVLSRFAHRDAARHAGEINTAELPALVKEATKALRLTEPDTPKT
ncbi:hypothetical protein FHE66_09370 [Georgenia sp. 311]|uniref:hypothetical protein n=1 Tax=Georgenia sp. 311 TaxID=2585134 RepID=UPI001112436C|nr:hypothetical protein [Georgenia sp. 311]TNC17642.1 hypothetical protein FHE66_09370 [Georgenia sp. 311]